MSKHRAVAFGWSLAAVVAGAAFAQDAAGPRAGDIVQGRLELQWGDAPGRAEALRVDLVRDDGHRIALDPAQARRAAGDLYALMNRRVAVSAAGGGGAQALRVDAMVPVQVVRAARDTALPSYRVAAAAPVSGNRRWVTLLCKFSDIDDEPRPPAFFREQYADAPGLLGRYWKEVSYGKVDIAGSDAYGWYRLPHPRSYYTPDGKRTDTYELFRDCVAAADAEVDFSAFDGVNTMYNGELDGFAWGGSGCAPFDGGPSICKPGTWTPPWGFENLATLAHEMGHGFGMPHSDNSDGDADSYDNPWDNMSDDWTNAASDPVYGVLPKHVNMYQRERMGWVDAARKATIASTSTAPVTFDLDYASLANASHKQLVVVTLPEPADPAAQVVYTFEARRPSGGFEARLAGDAVIVHRLEGYGTARSLDASDPAATRSDNEGSMFKVGERLPLAGTPLSMSVEARTATGFRIRFARSPTTARPLPALRK